MPRKDELEIDPQNPPEFIPLEHYGMIGDNRTCALLSPGGSIDWACLPDFDSPSVFSAILDPSAGKYIIQPAIHFTSRHHYEPSTNILVTEFNTENGRVRIRNFMPYAAGRKGPTAEIHRTVEGVTGHVPMHIIFAPRFKNGSEKPVFEQNKFGVMAKGSEKASLSLSANHPLEIDQDKGQVTSQFSVNSGEFHYFVADWGAKTVFPVQSYHSIRRIRITREFWRNWISRLTYFGRYREQVERALLTLKMLIYEPTGAIVAAPTTSLPEWIGGIRNWDYRYSWVRDSSFILRAFFKSGFIDEGTAYFDWILQLIDEPDKNDPQKNILKVLYGIRGEKEIPESEIPLRGYLDSKPVRIGNLAVDQFQLDIYGSLIEAAWLYTENGGVITMSEWGKLTDIIEYVRANWRRPDSGIWEARNEPQHYTYSKVWAWVTLFYGARLAAKLHLDDIALKLSQEAMEIHSDVIKNAWNPKKMAFTASYGSDHLDASVLILLELGFLEPGDIRFKQTLSAIRRELSAGKFPLLYRYLSDDGVGGEEGAFLMLSFWLAEALAISGDLQQSTEVLESLLQKASPLGLYGEMLHPNGNSHLGNFPQGFSMLGLVNAALGLENAVHEIKS